MKKDYKAQAIQCVGTDVLETQKKKFEECGRDFDVFYSQRSDDAYGYSVLVPGKVYELSYHKCTCPKVLSGEISAPEFCECSRQSILYILEQLQVPNKKFKVEIVDSVLRGGDCCKFRITVSNAMEKITKDAFCVIGKCGSTKDGEGFVAKIWNDANLHFSEIADLAVKKEDGSLAGIWGCMTNFSFDFQPWENDFTEGLYLAGVEAKSSAKPPKGWKKWIVPGFEYLKVPVTEPDTFKKTLSYMNEQGIALVGAVQDFTDPLTGQNYMLFPVEKNDSKQELIRKIKDETDPFAVCGFHCEYCFLSTWCGGCNSACNGCSFASCFEENVCPNVACALEKGVKGCFECSELIGCTKGFYSPTVDGANAAKALAVLRRDLGDTAVTKALTELHKKYDFQMLQQVLSKDLSTAVDELKENSRN